LQPDDEGFQPLPVNGVFFQHLKSDTGDQRFQKAIGRFHPDNMSFFIQLISMQFMFHAYCMNAWIEKVRSDILQASAT
jgi:hypothetical protein